MKIIRDTDTVEFVDDAGDKLVLREAPRQRDINASDDVERKGAMEQFQLMKELGVDTDAALAEAGKTDPKVLAAAKEKAEDFMSASAKVRECRFKALALKLIIDGTAINPSALADAYRDMPNASARWVDSKVAEVWKSATPTDAEKHRAGADAGVSAVEGAPTQCAG